ncbi:hypothetical protein AABM38_09855 [Heyndrickxia sp. MSNUG]|uniref:hypothetical protein n=1 Tax=Heyndrickxia sp. MSNUG TaxID=3136677 RepID=UPI003C2DF1DD
MDVEVVSFLFTRQYNGGEERCYLVRPLDDKTPQLGYDPEFTADEQTLTEVKWFPIVVMKEDLHVSRVIEAMKIAL